jgi:hypothetical protein
VDASSDGSLVPWPHKTRIGHNLGTQYTVGMVSAQMHKRGRRADLVSYTEDGLVTTVARDVDMRGALVQDWLDLTDLEQIVRERMLRDWVRLAVLA